MSRVSDRTRGVSPVIGVVILVGIVAILAATIGVFALGFSDQQPTQAPQVAIVADYSERTTGNGEYLNLSFSSGETVYRDNLSVVMSGAKRSDGSDVTLDTDPIQAQASTQITSGTQITIHQGQFTGIGSGEHLDLSDATLRLVWNPADEQESETYVIYRWPDPSQRN
ncbi:type IV pilin N-terminal domain-containing protein [Haloarcula sp. S1AR25-5A]|uniref:Type IV pilin N-terminal domain-containing protein n=1 Tax=Haloarcula terrestris TaxID=2950533 RepID=A0AAE4EW90_9EURY|nr:type IV pilin N-terminal domain-containing protein [Haloarcula terrestris]MDS0219946.1 type IV pilin N-terminal domain-containing protein [Haloarcula terrestris]